MDKDTQVVERLPYKLTSGSHTTRDKQGNITRYRAGTDTDTLMLTKDEAAAMGHSRLQPVAHGQFAPSVALRPVTATGGGTGEVKTGPPPGVGTAQGEPEATDWSALLAGMNAKVASEFIKDLDDVEDVKAAKAAEEGSDAPRSTVIDAANTRINQLSKDDE